MSAINNDLPGQPMPVLERCMNKIREALAHLTDWEKSPIYSFFKEGKKNRELKAAIANLKNDRLRIRQKESAAKWLLEKGGDAGFLALLESTYDGMRTREAIEKAFFTAFFAKAPVIPALAAALENEDKQVRLAAARMLPKLGDPSAALPLIKALEDTDEHVRQVAAEALTEFDYSRAVYPMEKVILPLISHLKDEDWHVWQCSAIALIRIGQQGHAGLKLIRAEGKKANEEGKSIYAFSKVYSAWSKALDEQAKKIVLDKKFHVPEVKKPDGVDRVMRVRRACA